MSETAHEVTDNSSQSNGFELVQSFDSGPMVYRVAWSVDGTFLASAGGGAVAIWSKATGERRLLQGHDPAIDEVLGLAWHPSHSILATASYDRSVRLWNADSGSDMSPVFCELTEKPLNVAWSPDGSLLAVTWLDEPKEKCGIDIRDTQNGSLLARYPVARRHIKGPCWSRNGELIITTDLNYVNVDRANNLESVYKLGAHTDVIYDVALSHDNTKLASASKDHTVRVWTLATGKEIVVLEGHTNSVMCVRFSADGEFLASLSRDDLRLWRCRDWECVATLPQKAGSIGGLDFHPHERLLASKDHQEKRIYWHRIDYALLGIAIQPGSRRYCNAKVVLLGDTGVGKSGLGMVLSGERYQPTESTHGRRIWTFDTKEVVFSEGGSQAREILLWDLAGQPGYRLVHQLHLNEVAIALVVFDSRSETDPFAGVKHWVRALSQARQLEGAAAVPMRTYLVAARADRGGVAVTRERIQKMINDLGLNGFFETSAKEGWQVTELADAIRGGIAWESLPMVSSSALFDSIKQFLLEEKQQGRVLSTVEDLFRSYQRTQSDASHDDLRASFDSCIGRLESRDLIRRLHFGGLVLMQPELLDAYASAMVQAAKEEPDGLGFIREDDALAGRFRLSADERVSDRDQEKLLLIATIEELLRYEIALKEVTDQGVDLVFPSQFTRERPGAPDIPGRRVTFTFEGPLHNVYASLAVRLAHSSLFRRQSMWQNAATYTATVGGSCGIYLLELEGGRGELALFFDEQASETVRIQFETYVAEHLQLRALPETITRRRIRACPDCDYTLPDDLIQRRLARGMTTIRCPDCSRSVIPLVDKKASARTEDAVFEMNRSADEKRDQEVAATRLRGKIETNDFDVFLCYNSRDKSHVVAIGERLKARGILPWLDIWEIRPGMRWQRELQRNIRRIKAAAIFIGPRGTGPWQELEVESLLQEIARRNNPVIPVILEGRLAAPRLPSFLSSWHMVDMRRPIPDPFEQLLWGITGEKPREFLSGSRG